MNQKTIAALQMGSHLEGTQATIEKVLSFQSDIQQAKPDLVVMPEALLGGYPKGADFHTRVGYRTDQGREEYLAYWQQAIELPGPEIQQIAELAKNCNTYIVIGVIERMQATLFCTAVYINNEGNIVGKHRKLLPTASERLIWGRGDGSTIHPVDTPLGKVGAAICWENYMPLFRTSMYAAGVDIWCAPTVDDREIWQASMRHIAYEGRCFLVSACQFLPSPQERQQQLDHWPDDKDLIRGGSMIVHPLGEILAGPLVAQEGLIAATIDLEDIIKARYDLDPTGHYARPDIFDLKINR